MGLGGEDYIAGGVGDRICGGDGDDLISGGRFLSGGRGNDYMVGKKGPNLFIGGRGNDRADLEGGGKDVVRGGAGNDRVDAPSQRIDRGDNEIIVDLAEGFITSIQTERTRLYSIERATTCTSASRAKIYGTAGRNSLLSLCEGGATIYGRGGDDLLWGGNEKRDRIFGGPGDDLIRGRGGDDYLDGGTGTDACYGGETTVRCE